MKKALAKLIKKGFKRTIAMSTLNVVVIMLLLATALCVVLTNVYSHRVNEENEERHQLTYYANQFMEGSAYLTRQARAYCATAEQQYYDAYWDEVNVAKNRDNGVAMIKKIGITPLEEAMADDMIKLSNDLVPLEERAMELAGAGDISGALDIVYGEYYSESIDRIAYLRNQFLQALTDRTTADVKDMAEKRNVINIVSWFMVALAIVLQVMQNRALHRLAYVDPLTKGDNYTAFREKMRGGIGVSGAGYVVSADLRGFSFINDTCGIVKGDEIIHDMGRIFEQSLGQGELSAHVSGDRFVLFMHSSSMEQLVERITAMRQSILDLSPKLGVPHIVPLFGIREVDGPLHPENAYSDANISKHRLKDGSDSFYSVYQTQEQRSAS